MKVKKEKVLLLALLVSSGIMYGPFDEPLEGGFDLDGSLGDGDIDNNYNDMSRKPNDTTLLDANRLKQLEEELRNQDGTDSRNTVARARTQVNLINPVTNGSVAPTITIASSVNVSDLMDALDNDYTINGPVVSGNIERTPEYDSLMTSKKALKAALAEPVFKKFPNDSELIKRFTAIKTEMKTLLDAINTEMRNGNTDTQELKKYTNQLNALKERCSELARVAQKEQERQVQAAKRITEVERELKSLFAKPLLKIISQSPSKFAKLLGTKDPYANERSFIESAQRSIKNIEAFFRQGKISEDQFNEQIKKQREEIDTQVGYVKSARKTEANNFIKSKNSLGYWNDDIGDKYAGEINKYVDGEITLKQFKAVVKPSKPGILGRLFGSGKTKPTKPVTSESPLREKPSTGPVISSPTDGRVFIQAPEVFQSAAVKELNTLLIKQNVSQEFLNQKNKLSKEAGNVKNQEELKAFLERIDVLSGKKKQVPVIDSASAA